MPTGVEPEPEAPVAYVLGRTGWMRWFKKVPTPVVALAGRNLYSVVLRGSGFLLTIEGLPGAAIGFYTNRFVAARSVREAEARAIASVQRTWRAEGLESLTGATPNVEIESIGHFGGWFKLRSRTGLAFYPTD